MEQTKSIIYRHPAHDVEKTKVYAVEVLNADEFFGCRFLIRSVPLGDSATRVQMAMRGIVNSEEFREFWARQNVKVPDLLQVTSAEPAHETTYHYKVSLPNPVVTIPMWAKGYTKEHALEQLRKVLANMDQKLVDCTVEEA